MSLEITVGQSRYQYRIAPHDACLIQRRVNKHNAHWLNYARKLTPTLAKRALLRLQAEQND